MKKWILIALLAALTVTAVSCGTNDENPSATESDTSATTVEPAESAESVTETETTPETEAPETEAPETETPETETIPETEAPETEAPETEAPETEAPETEAPETEPAGPTWQSGDNVALNKYVQASGSAWDGDMWGIQMVTDGSVMQTEFEGGTNGWMSQTVANVTDPTWISVDLGQEYPINKIVLYPRQSGERFPTGFYIEVSTDGSNWTKVAEETADPYTLEGRVFEFESIEAAYVRLTTTELREDSYADMPGGSGYMAQISEIEVYAS